MLDHHGPILRATLKEVDFFGFLFGLEVLCFKTLVLGSAAKSHSDAPVRSCSWITRATPIAAWL